MVALTVSAKSAFLWASRSASRRCAARRRQERALQGYSGLRLLRPQGLHGAEVQRQAGLEDHELQLHGRRPRLRGLLRALAALHAGARDASLPARDGEVRQT